VAPSDATRILDAIEKLADKMDSAREDISSLKSASEVGAEQMRQVRDHLARHDKALDDAAKARAAYEATLEKELEREIEAVEVVLGGRIEAVKLDVTTKFDAVAKDVISKLEAQRGEVAAKTTAVAVDNAERRGIRGVWLQWGGVAAAAIIGAVVMAVWTYLKESANPKPAAASPTSGSKTHEDRTVDGAAPRSAAPPAR
jgi:outer membrane translocation and assembly module TamA